MTETIELLRKTTEFDRTELKDIVDDETLTTAEKRAILASWVSDVHAVENAPALRKLDNGATVCVDDVLQALQSLDGGIGAEGGHVPAQTVFSRRRRASVAGWLRRAMRRHNSDDDDPPPCPASIAVPGHRTLTDAWRMRSPGGTAIVTSSAAP